MRSWWETLGPLRRTSPCPPTLSLPHTWGPEQRGWGASHSPIWWHLDQGAQQVLRRAGEASRPGGPHPVGDERLESVEGHPRGPLWREAGQSHRREGGGPGRLLARPGRTQSPSPPALELPRATVCAVRAMTGQTPPVPGRLPVDSRGRWAGTRLRREPRFPRRDADGHPTGTGLPAQRLHPSPSSGSRPVAGRTARWQGHKEQDWPLTPRTGGRVPGSCTASPGHLHVTEPCLLTPVPACPSTGPSPACWKYGWIIMGTTFVSSPNFPPL